MALGNTKLNEISIKSLIDDTSKTSVYLKNLIELGVVEREFSVSESVKEKANTNKGLYRITDNFFRFWYAFVFTNISELDGGDVDGVYKYSIEPQLHEFAAMPFEDICREYVRELQKAGKLPFRYAKMGRWWGKTTVRRGDEAELADTEIDLLAVSKQFDKFIVGECKFKGKPFRYSEYLDTITKLSDRKDKAEFRYSLFSESGFDEKIIEQAQFDSRLVLCGLDEIVGYR